jgi:hypothetical protein
VVLFKIQKLSPYQSGYDEIIKKKKKKANSCQYNPRTLPARWLRGDGIMGDPLPLHDLTFSFSPFVFSTILQGHSHSQNVYSFVWCLLGPKKRKVDFSTPFFSS